MGCGIFIKEWECRIRTPSPTPPLSDPVGFSQLIRLNVIVSNNICFFSLNVDGSSTSSTESETEMEDRRQRKLAVPSSPFPLSFHPSLDGHYYIMECSFSGFCLCFCFCVSVRILVLCADAEYLNQTILTCVTST